jgi:hypothetical protein
VKERIQELLARELQKIEMRSLTTPEPLPAADIKSLDVLIKAYRSFSDPTKNPDKPAPDDPTQTSLEDLLSGIPNPSAIY